MISLEIVQSLDGADPLDGFADRPFLNPGALRLAAGRKTPRWLPPVPGYVYAGTGGDMYGVGPDAAGKPVRVGDLADLVFGREMLRRFVHADQAGYIFATQEAKVLADCLQDDTELDLPAGKARGLIEAGRRVYLTRNVMSYALLEAVRVVGRGNGRRSAGAEGEAWTMRRIFGTIS